MKTTKDGCFPMEAWNGFPRSQGGGSLSYWDSWVGPEHPEPSRPVTSSDLNTKIIFYMFPDVKEDGRTDSDLSTRVRDKPITRLSN